MYKVAAFWGYSRMILASLPGQRVCFAPEIRHYAPLAELSPELWSPMVEAVPRDTAEQIMTNLVGLANAASRGVDASKRGAE